MNLRTKTLLILGITLAGAILIILALSATLLVNSFTGIEKKNTLDSVQLAENALSADIRQLELLTSDWARWDESYNFVQDSNQEFIRSNLNTESLANLDIDYIAFLDANRSVVYSTGYDSESGTVVQIPSSTLQIIRESPVLTGHDSLTSIHSGIMMFPDKLLFIASEPIITSTYEGPIKGTLVMARMISPSRIHDIQARTGLNFSITGISPGSLQYSDISGEIGNQSGIIIRTPSDDLISGEKIVPDITGEKNLRLTIYNDRIFFKQGLVTIQSYIFLLVFACSLLVIVSLLIVDRFVLKKLKDLIEFIRKRQRSGLSDDPFFESRDEFRELLNEIIPVFNNLSRSEHELHKSEERYRNVVENQLDLICRFTPQGQYLYVNQAYCNFFGKSQDELLSGSFRGILPGEDIARTNHYFASLTPECPVATLEDRIGDGDTTRWIQWTDLAIFNNEGVVTEYQSIGRDITERKIAEAEIQKLASIVNNTRTGIVTGSGTRVNVINPAFIQMHGYSSDDLKTMDVCLLICPDFCTIFNSHLKRAEQSGHHVFEVEHVRKDGTTFPTLNDLTVIKDHDGQMKYWILNVQDITDHRIAWNLLMESEALRESARQLREVIALLPDATFVVDKDGWVIIWNKAMEEITGIPAETIVGRGQEEYSIPFYGKKRPMLIDFVLNSSMDPDAYYKYLIRDGDCISTEGHISRNNRDIYLLASANPLFNSHGKLIGAIETLRDISMSKMAEMNLIRTNEKLHLLSSITRHDIRNRLTVLRSLLPLIKPDNVDPEVREYYDLIERATMSISDQIEFTRDYQEMGIRAPEWMDTGEIIEKIKSSGLVENVTLINSLLNVIVYADPLLERVFYNLIDNAIRHGKTVQKISFSWTLEDNRLIIHCEDDGIGIEEQDKERIFDRGYGSNTGLGLFLVREILSITRISIKETGVNGSGACFEIVVPFGSYTLPK